MLHKLQERFHLAKESGNALRFFTGRLFVHDMLVEDRPRGYDINHLAGIGIDQTREHAM